MASPAIPTNEEQRLRTLQNYLILDTPPEYRFDILTEYAAVTFDVPTALISLVDENRQWFKSRCGLDTPETPRDVSFCGHAILDDGILMICNASLDPKFSDNPLVTGSPFIRFYAGCPLTMPSGDRIGTFCLIDYKPRHPLDEWELDHLRLLAKIASLEIQGIDASQSFMDTQAVKRQP